MAIYSNQGLTDEPIIDILYLIDLLAFSSCAVNKVNTMSPTKKPSTKAKAAPAAAAQVHVDPALTLALAQASVAAYSAFDNQKVVPPAGYVLRGLWTGWDGAWWESGREELFGLVFQSTSDGQQGTFIFAFRGTDSDLDAYEDAFFNTTAFKPLQGKVAPTPYVSDGFYDIYSTKGGSVAMPMREQLFALVDRLKPTKLYITGHSLGAALSQLFSLDIALSRPAVWAANLNFASPMVGTAVWRAVYESQVAERDPARRTVRVYNYMDWVPSTPPALFNYLHVGSGFRTSFHVKDEWYPHLLARHAILNLQRLLVNAVWLNPQVWVGTFPDATDNGQRMMQSTVPPAGADVAWADKFKEFQAFEQSVE
jgi:hypothetical protein